MRTLGLGLAVVSLVLFGVGGSVALAVSGSSLSACAASGYVDIVNDVYTFKCPGICPDPDTCEVLTIQGSSGATQYCMCAMQGGGGYYYYYETWPGDTDAQCEMEWVVAELGAVGTAFCTEINCTTTCYSSAEYTSFIPANGTITCPCKPKTP